MFIATGFGLGFWPWGPGTLAGFFALLLWGWIYTITTATMLAVYTLILIGFTLFLGVYTDNIMEKYWGEDPRAVVIDEFLGTWIAAMAALFCTGPWLEPLLYATIGFILFRIIDIWKPLGCRWVDQHIHGGWGCMLDDALAGFYAFLITLLIRVDCGDKLVYYVEGILPNIPN